MSSPVVPRRAKGTDPGPAPWCRVAAAAIICAALALPGAALACGWGGENDEDEDIPEIEVDAAGNPVAESGTAAGDPEYQTRMGDRYRTGDGFPKDLAEAARRYRMAAERGYAPAQNNLGVMYERGLGVPRSDARAAEWYRRAAEAGNPAALHSLGRMHLEGRGVERDEVEGARLVVEAARRGHASAMTDAGDLYHAGRGVAADEGEARRWWRAAAARGDAKAARRLAGGAEDRPAAERIATSVDESALPAGKRTSLHLYLTAREASEALAADPRAFRVLDVRTVGEFVFVGHVPGAYNVPIAFLEPTVDSAGRLRLLRPNERFVAEVRRRFAPGDRILVICRSGHRSARAADRLARAGFREVYSVVDGFEGDRVADPARPDHGERTLNGWKNAGAPWTHEVDPEHLYLRPGG